MTQGITAAFPVLARLHAAARQDSRLRFNNLLHPITEDMLERAYRALNHKAATGIDGVDWKSYGVELAPKLKDLCHRLHGNRYRAQPVKRVWVPKDNGQQRPIGITTLEDKIVQQALVWILESIYEADFAGVSYGFRPNRNQHGALDAVYMAIMTKKVSWVLDADIQGFFDNINHKWLMKFLEQRISDPRILRLIKLMLTAGVMDQGCKSRTVVGTPQGAVISPILGNIYLHYALDLWVDQWRHRHARGEVYVVRYADDSVFCFQYKSDGERFLEALGDRLAKFNLNLNRAKTHLIEFGRFAEANRAGRGTSKPHTFDFLGFTHICSRRRSDNGFSLLRKTISKRQCRTLSAIKVMLKKAYHQRPVIVGGRLKAILQGYFNYFAVPGNLTVLDHFRTAVVRMWIKAMRRRSQKGKYIPWRRYARLITLFIPKARAVHPYPLQRWRV
jgi:RNA-directed DNA polymerase